MAFFSLVVPLAAWPIGSRSPHHRPCARRAPDPVLELGFQFDPAASIGPIFALSGYAGLQLKIRQARAAQVERDAATELARIAKKRLLAGEVGVEDVERAEEAARQALVDYDEARQVAVLPGALLRIPDPTARRRPDGETETPTAAPPGTSTGQASGQQPKT